MNQANIFQDNVQALRRGAMSGAHVARLMEVCDVSISDVARSLQVDQARVRQVRAAGVTGAIYVEDWIWGIQKSISPTR